MLSENHKQIIEELTPFVISFTPNVDHFNFNIWGYEKKDFYIVDPLRRNALTFWQLVKAIDCISFGAQGMGMENWVMFDCGAMPSSIVGFCMNKSRLSPEFLQMLGVDSSYEGPIPISFYIAIPTVQPGQWFGHNLSSLNNSLPKKYPGLGIMTKALGIKLMQIEVMYGATQWGNPAIHVHSQLAPMEILSSYTPVHTHPNSLCYRSVYPIANLDDESLGTQKRIAQKYDFLLDPEDASHLIGMQEKIELGERFCIVGRPLLQEGKVAYPISRME